MNHDQAHCKGEAYGHTCRLRDRCRRYILHLDTHFLPGGRFPYLLHESDISDGCGEFVANK